MKLLSHPHYATVASTTALVLALGGTSYAAAKITGAGIADGSITTKDVKNKSLALKDLSPATRGKLQGAPGAPGAKGPAGPTGPAGKDGPSYARLAYDNTDTILTNQVSGEDPRVIAVGGLGASYLLLGKVVLTNNTNANTAVRCTLAAQNDSDLAAVSLPPLMSTTISLQLAHTYTGLGAYADIRCFSFGNAARAEVAKLTLIKVGDLEVVNAG
jgi:hypothetical protein